jgi:heme exporter protein A
LGAKILAELLTGTDLSLLRGERCLFENLNFALNAGELLLVQGANGSGMTCLLRSIAGLTGLETGYISWQGVPTERDRQSFSAEVVCMAHRVGFKGDLTLIENLRFETGLRSATLAGIDEVLERLSISRLIDLPLRYLSAGQQRRVALARMLISDARLWLMDEPFTNLDAAGQSLVVDLISEHLAKGGAGVIAAHKELEISVPVQKIQLQ